MLNHSDEELVALYKESNDPQFLTTLFTRHSDIVYRSAMRIMKNASDAEDVMQTSYIKMIRDLRLFRGTGSVLGWMLQVVINTCYQHKNSEKSRFNREKIIMSERPSTINPKNSELSETIETHLNKLPEIYKVPITLQIMEGLSVKEVSQALSIPEKTIRSQIARGLEKLKVSLQTVGISASIASLGDLLKSIQQPLAPEAIKSSQYFQSIFQAKTATSTKLAMSSGANGVFSQKLIGAGILIFFSLSTLFFWQPFFNKDVMTATSTSYQKWDFENTNNLALYQNIGLLSGSIWIENLRGVNSSKGLMLSEKTIIEFDISKYKLPLKISYVTDTYRFTNKTDPIQTFFKSNYIDNDKINHFFGFRERIILDISTNDPNTKFGFFGKWVSHEVYIDENFIDFYVEGKRSHILYGTSKDNKRLYLYAYRSIIDNLVIESIDKQQVPDEFTISRAKYKLYKEDGVDKYYLNKEDLGLNNSSVNPFFIRRTADSIVSNFGLNNKAVFPSLDATNKVLWVKPKNGKSNQWNFENSNDLKGYQNIGLLQGGISIVSSLGVEGSHALVVDSESILVFDISEYQLPVRVSYKLDPLMSMSGFGQIVLKNNYIKNNSLIHLSSLREIIQMPRDINNFNSQIGFTGKWYTQECYVSDQYVDLWVDGQPSHYIRGISSDNQKIFLYIKGQSVIDDLKIESIEHKDLPCHALHDELISLVDIKKDVYRYLLDKTKLGIDKNSDTQPSMALIDAEKIEAKLNLNSTPLYPLLDNFGKVKWVKKSRNTSKNWSFDSGGLNNISVVYGKAEIVTGKGVNQSNCLLVEADTLLEFDISDFQLPLKLIHIFDCKLTAGVEGRGIVVLKGNYEVHKNIFNFSKISEAVTIDISESVKAKRNENIKSGYFGEWFKRDIYVSDDCIDVWLNDKRTAIVFGKSYDNKKLYLLVKDQTLFDDFEFQSVSLNEVPGHAAFKKLTEKIPFKQAYFNFNLENEIENLSLEKKIFPRLEIYDKFTIESSLGLRKPKGDQKTSQ